MEKKIIKEMKAPNLEAILKKFIEEYGEDFLSDGTKEKTIKALENEKNYRVYFSYSTYCYLYC